MGNEVKVNVESKSARVMFFMAAPKLAAAVMAMLVSPVMVRVVP
ncbi:hypothetical protein [Coprothermobacter proteolyticus]|nr:hypothetical protein [Coprothermobacter proteolyticus]